MPLANAPVLDPQLDVLVDDDHAFWARSIVADRKKLKGPHPLSAVDLEAAITAVRFQDTMKGSSTMTVSILDQGWKITDGGFFDADADGRVDPIEVNYPVGSEQWWRMTQVGLDSTVGAAKLDLTFMERPAVYLMEHFGPVKISRAKRTRAEFLKMLHDKVHAGGGIQFHSRELTDKQKQAGLTPSEQKSEKQKKKTKDKGINVKETISFLNWDGNPYTLKPGELRNAERVLDEAVKHTTNHKVLLALCEACIVEAPMFRNPLGGDSSSVGILQLLDIFGPVSKRRDIAWVVKQFLTVGFAHYSGAIKTAKDHPDWTAGQIAQWVQGSGYPERYEKVKDGAEQVINSYGGSGGANREYRQQYNFEVGSIDKPHEDFWTAVNRLAEEVKWAYFLDGNDAYYDSEPELVTQKPVSIIHRGDPAVVRFSSNWDGRHIATEATLELVCDPFEFRAGEVFKLEGLGPASTGSTAGFPGRWLISESDRPLWSLVTTFTLKQPEDPNPEPRSQTATRQQKQNANSPGAGITGEGAMAAVQWAQSKIGHYREEFGANRGKELDALERSFGFQGAAWCAIFATTAVSKGGSSSVKTAAVATIRQWAQEGSHGYQQGFKAKPQPGDLMCFGTAHVAFIERVRGDTVTTIEGNTSAGKVARNTRGAHEGVIVRPEYGTSMLTRGPGRR